MAGDNLMVLINDQRFDFRCAEIDTQIHSHLLVNQRVNGGDFLAHQRREIRVVGEITKQGFITGEDSHRILSLEHLMHRLRIRDAVLGY